MPKYVTDFDTMDPRKIGADYHRYTVTFSCDAFPDVVALLDEGPPQVMGGDGGWTVTARERRIGLTQWTGNDPVRLAIPILFDHHISNITNQSHAIRNLQLMGRPPYVNAGEPPVITVKSKGIRWPTSKGSKQEWVIESITWGTNVLNHTDWLRQDAVVNLLQYIDEDYLKFKAPKISKHRHHKKKHRKADGGVNTTVSGKGFPKFYTIMPGDTLPKIAAKFYKDRSMWPKIAAANGIRDPQMLKFYFVLIIPPP